METLLPHIKAKEMQKEIPIFHTITFVTALKEKENLLVAIIGGWYQIKGMLKEYFPNELKEFNELYKALADKMRPMVYELGFLK